MIVENRPNYSEDVTTLSDIDDIRNGIIAEKSVLVAFDSHHAAVLKVCHICPPVSVVLCLTLVPAPILRLQTIFSKSKTFLHATTKNICWIMSGIRLQAVTLGNG